MIGQTDTPINAGPQQHYVAQAALAHLARWAAGGEAPPSAPSPRARRRPDGLRPRRARHRPGRDPHAVGRRADRGHGRASGRAASPSPCSSAAPSPSTTPPWRRCTPAGEDEYLERFAASLDAAIAAGFLLEEDRMEILAVAAALVPLAAGRRLTPSAAEFIMLFPPPAGGGAGCGPEFASDLSSRARTEPADPLC